MRNGYKERTGYVVEWGMKYRASMREKTGERRREKIKAQRQSKRGGWKD